MTITTITRTGVDPVQPEADFNAILDSGDPCADLKTLNAQRNALSVTETKTTGTQWCAECNPPRYLDERTTTTTRVTDQAEYDRLTKLINTLQKQCNEQNGIYIPKGPGARKAAEMF